MEIFFFKGIALLYTVLIIFGTMVVPGIIVNSMIVLLKEALIANPDSTILPKFLQEVTKPVFDFNKLPEESELIEREVLFSKVS